MHIQAPNQLAAKLQEREAQLTALKHQQDDNRHDNHTYTNTQARDQLAAKLKEGEAQLTALKHDHRHDDHIYTGDRRDDHIYTGSRSVGGKIERERSAIDCAQT